MSELLANKLSSVRSRHSATSLGSGVALAVTVLVCALALGMLLDWWLDLPRAVRAAFLAIDLSLLVLILVTKVVLPIASAPADDEVALRVEDAHPQFGSRLIAAIQLGRPNAVPAGASAAFVRATIAQAESIARGIDFANVIPTDRTIKLSIAAALAVVLGLTAFALGRRDNVSSDLLARAFLSNTPVPRKTRIDVLSGDFKIGRGETAELRAQARGVIPADGVVEIKFDSGRQQSPRIEAAPGEAATFALKLENVQDSFKYRVKLGDNTSEWRRADVLIPPVVTRLECQQVYPEYTRLGAVARSLGDLSILSGSRLMLKVTANNRIAPNAPSAVKLTNFVHLVNPDNVPDVALSVDPANPTQLTADVPIPPKTSGFSIHLRDVNGLVSKDPAVYRIDLVPDKEPTVRITYPDRKEELVTRIATVEIGFDAADDFGIAKLALKYKIDDGPEQAIPLEIAKAGNPTPKTLHNRFVWPLSKLTPRSTTQPTLEGSTVEYWLEAEDNNNVTGPGRGSSEHYSAKVVSEAEKRAEILARLGASIQDIERAREDQEALHKGLGDIVLERKQE